MTELERLKKILVLTLRVVWAVLVGVIRADEIEPLKVKKHGQLEKSIFRYGFDALRHSFLHAINDER